MPRFVLLYHDCPPHYERPSHWDLMLEAGGALRTWALRELPRDWLAAYRRTAELDPNCPPLAAESTVAAEPLGDHRLAYLELEGPLSGDRGAVKRIDAGALATHAESRDCWNLSLTGDLVRGEICLRAGSPAWSLSLEAGR
jgi:hypothetical protein